MKRQDNEQEEVFVTLRLWNYPRAIKALPYLTSVLRSIRDAWLERQQARRRIQQIQDRSRADSPVAARTRQAAQAELERTEQRFQEALDELTSIDVYCLDASRGLALIPFRLGDDLAWFVFELFTPQGLASWRYHSDPLHVRRSVIDIPSAIMSSC